MTISICETCKHRGSKACRQPEWAVVEKCPRYEKVTPDVPEDDIEAGRARSIETAGPGMRSNAFPTHSK